MNTNGEKFLMKGLVKETLPSRTFLVTLENGATIMCHLSGKMRQNKISILVDDKVDVEMSLYDLTKGRIVYRHIN